MSTHGGDTGGRASTGQALCWTPQNTVVKMTTHQLSGLGKGLPLGLNFINCKMVFNSTTHRTTVRMK